MLFIVKPKCQRKRQNLKNKQQRKQAKKFLCGEVRILLLAAKTKWLLLQTNTILKKGDLGVYVQ